MVTSIIKKHPIPGTQAVQSHKMYSSDATMIGYTLDTSLIGRPRPIMLKILPIMLLSSAQKISLLCSILCS